MFLSVGVGVGVGVDVGVGVGIGAAIGHPVSAVVGVFVGSGSHTRPSYHASYSSQPNASSPHTQRWLT